MESEVEEAVNVVLQVEAAMEEEEVANNVFLFFFIGVGSPQNIGTNKKN